MCFRKFGDHILFIIDLGTVLNSTFQNSQFLIKMVSATPRCSNIDLKIWNDFYTNPTLKLLTKNLETLKSSGKPNIKLKLHNKYYLYLQNWHPNIYIAILLGAL